MSPFFGWLLAALASFGTLSGSYHLYLERNPQRVVVVLDASYPMRDAWSRVPGAIARIAGRRYTEYALFTDKGKVHDFAADIRYGKVSAYAPRDFAKLAGVAGSPEFDAASEVVLVTNAPAGEVVAFAGWSIVHVGR